MSMLCSISKRPKLVDLPNDPDDLVYLATLAASGRRLEHMYDYMKRFVEILEPSERLHVQVRKYFRSACNAYIKGKRDSYHYVAKIAADLSGVDQRRTDLANEYLPIISMEIDTFCRDVLNTIDVYFLYPFFGKNRTVSLVEPLLFYRTMKGDFLRYLALVKTESENQGFVEEAKESYRCAKREEGRLPATNPTRLDMQLSLAHFISEVTHRPSKGYRTAREAIELATRDLQAAGELPSEETAAALSRLRDFLSLWADYA